jgi:hypothetical protein
MWFSSKQEQDFGAKTKAPVTNASHPPVLGTTFPGPAVSIATSWTYFCAAVFSEIDVVMNSTWFSRPQ